MSGGRAIGTARSAGAARHRWPLLGSAALVLAGSAACWWAIAWFILVCLNIAGKG